MATKSIFDCDSSPINEPKPERELISYDDDDLFAFGSANDEVDSAPKKVSMTITVDNTIGKRSIKRKTDDSPKVWNKKPMLEARKKNGKTQRKYGSDPASGEYELLGEIGRGTYSRVYKAQVTSTKTIIAVKRLHIKLNVASSLPFTKREYDNLNELKDCEHVVQILKGREEQLSKNDLQVDLLLEYCPYVLKDIIENKFVRIHLSEIKGILRQMLVGLSYMHNKSIMHRDFKSENILLTGDGVVKIADFGLSRRIIDPTATLEKEKYTPLVVTLWYRAPEILFGQSYTEQCDMWSVGCIMGEFWHRSAILQGDNEIGQIKLIARLCGTENLPTCKEIQLPKHSRMTRDFLKEKLPKVLDDQANIFFDKLMQCDFEKRLTASRALNENFFYSEPLPLKKLTDFMSRIIPVLSP